MSPSLRVGLLVPSSNTVMENDLHVALEKPRVTVHTARMWLTETTAAAEREMVDDWAPTAARLLRTVNPDLLVFGCTSAGSLDGLEGDRVLGARLGAIAGCPGIGVISSAVEALRCRRARRVALLTPYIEPLTAAIAATLGQAGIQVVASHGLGISDNVALAEPTPQEIVGTATERFSGVECDALFVSCTNFRALEAAATVHARLDIPVVTSNLAVVEAIQRRLAQGVPAR